MRVMRAELHDRVEVIDGQGGLARGTISSLTKEHATIQITEYERHDRPVVSIALLLPIIHHSRLEWAVEKAVELGVASITIFAADASDRKGLSESQKRRLEHIIISAMKQSGELFSPKITYCAHLRDSLGDTTLLFFGDLHGQGKSLTFYRTLLERYPHIAWVVGPEGGFSEKEMALLQARGKPLLLHRNTLRAETAAIVGCALLINALEEGMR